MSHISCSLGVCLPLGGRDCLVGWRESSACATLFVSSLASAAGALVVRRLVLFFSERGGGAACALRNARRCTRSLARSGRSRGCTCVVSTERLVGSLVCTSLRRGCGAADGTVSPDVAVSSDGATFEASISRSRLARCSRHAANSRLACGPVVLLVSRP